MFCHKKIVHLRETDATGVIYFTSLLQYGVEAFEVFLHAKEICLSSLLSQGNFFPIVHAEANYKTPLYPGDPIEIQLILSHLGNRSFTLESQIFKVFKDIPSLTLAGSTKITHAFLKQGSQETSEIPTEFRSLFQKELIKK